MGFTTGFLGGLTFTYTVLYLSIHLHRTNRQQQSLLLTQQKILLTSLTSPPLPEAFETPAYELRRAGLAEQLKDRWNREVSSVVRGLQEKDWSKVRERFEDRASNLWGNLRDSGVGKEVEGRFKENVVGVEEGAERAAKEAVQGKRLLEIK